MDDPIRVRMNTRGRSSKYLSVSSDPGGIALEGHSGTRIPTQARHELMLARNELVAKSVPVIGGRLALDIRFYSRYTADGLAIFA